MTLNITQGHRQCGNIAGNFNRILTAHAQKRLFISFFVKTRTPPFKFTDHNLMTSGVLVDKQIDIRTDIRRDRRTKDHGIYCISIASHCKIAVYRYA